MRLTINDPKNADYAVLLNNRPICAVAADDQEGWVDIVDLAALAPDIASLDESDEPGGADDTAEWAEVPIKRLTGDVVIKKL